MVAISEGSGEAEYKREIENKKGEDRRSERKRQ